MSINYLKIIILNKVLLFNNFIDILIEIIFFT